ncbi:MAG: GNAT family N-acetyltransferase [Fuerstiella sp.]|nr:GNAT family N-acetyltransferase [Fuerstiella sp.]
MQSRLLPSATVKDGFRIVADHQDGYCWTALHGNYAVLQIRGLLNPDGPVDLVCAQNAELSSDAIQDIWDQVLVETLIVASDSRRNSVRCLVEAGCPVVSTVSLAAHGFEPTVRLQALRHRSELSGKEDPGIHCQPLADAITGYGTKNIEELIAGCLDGSQDLQALDPVTPHGLLSGWISLPDSELLVAQDQNRLAGLAVVTRDTDACLVTVEYLGVVRHFRRQGIAGRLLKQVSSGCVSDLQQSKSNDIVAYCDRENEPAVQLYRAGGFSPGETHTIWQHDLRDSGLKNVQQQRIKR